jgi:hypothetical protein
MVLKYRMRWAGHIARMGERPIEGPKSRLECNIKMDVKVIVWEGMDWIHLALDRDWWCPDVNIVIKLFREIIAS